MGHVIHALTAWVDLASALVSLAVACVTARKRDLSGPRRNLGPVFVRKPSPHG